MTRSVWVSLPNPVAMYYFAGPPAMTLTMRTLLQVMGVPATSMHSEEFYGY